MDNSKAGESTDSIQSGGGKAYVLVHGAFHGGWCWKEVAEGLRAKGHTVFTPTQTGLGERSHLLGTKPNMETFIQDILQVLHYEDLHDVILVGHSFGGSTVSGVADRMPERLRHLVYLDAMVLYSGESAMSRVPGEIRDRYMARAEEFSGGISVPPNDPEYYGITEPAMAAWLSTKLDPHPFQTFLDPLELRHPLCNGIPATYIACSNPFFSTTVKSRELARSTSGWRYLEIPTAHNAMMLMPTELTEMLAAIN